MYSSHFGYLVMVLSIKNVILLLVFALGEFCAEGVTLDTAIYIISWPERCAAKFRQGHAQDTWHCIYRRVVYCFKTPFYGKYLDVDEFDQPWPAGSDEAARAGQWLTPNEDRFVVWNLEGGPEAQFR